MKNSHPHFHFISFFPAEQRKFSVPFPANPADIPIMRAAQIRLFFA
jgi:hypothetical protein